MGWSLLYIDANLKVKKYPQKRGCFPDALLSGFLCFGRTALAPVIEEFIELVFDSLKSALNRVLVSLRVRLSLKMGEGVGGDRESSGQD